MKRPPKNKQAQHAVDFINNLHLTSGYYGQNFVLRKWQENIVRRLFGTLDKKGERLIQRAMFLLPRGNAKTELAGAICLYCLCFFPPGQEIYSFASEREQAAVIFKSVQQMVEQDEFFNFLTVVPSQKRIVNERKHSFYCALSSEAKSKAGLRPSVVIAEELHTYKNDDLYQMLQTGLAKRDNPLWINVTTAGRADPNHICYQEFCYARDVQDGIIKNPKYLPVLYYSDHEKDDWQDEKVWHKCNPALGDFKNLNVMREEFEIAKAIPSRQTAFRRDHLCQWLSSDSKWVDMALWDECEGVVNPHELIGAECIGGLDLAPVNDLSCLTLLFNIDGVHKVLPFVFCPQDDIEKRSKIDKVPYDLWQRQGYLKPTPGGSTDFEFIRQEIMKLNETYRIKMVAADRAFAYQLGQNLVEDGLNVTWFNQNAISMNGPLLELEKMLIDKSIHHGGNPIMRWCASNMVVEHNATGLVRPAKKKSMERIDGIVSLLFAIGVGLTVEEKKPSIYEDASVPLWIG